MRPLGGLGVGFGLWSCDDRTRRRRGGKVEISRLVRDFQGSVGAGENLLLVFAGFHAPAFSTALFRVCWDQLVSFPVKTAHHVRPVTDRDRRIQMLVDGYRTPGQSVAKLRLLDLPYPVPNGHRVVFGH